MKPFLFFIFLGLTQVSYANELSIAEFQQQEDDFCNRKNNPLFYSALGLSDLGSRGENSTFGVGSSVQIGDGSQTRSRNGATQAILDLELGDRIKNESPTFYTGARVLVGIGQTEEKTDLQRVQFDIQAGIVPSFRCVREKINEKVSALGFGLFDANVLLDKSSEMTQNIDFDFATIWLAKGGEVLTPELQYALRATFSVLSGFHIIELDPIDSVSARDKYLGGISLNPSLQVSGDLILFKRLQLGLTVDHNKIGTLSNNMAINGKLIINDTPKEVTGRVTQAQFRSRATLTRNLTLQASLDNTDYAFTVFDINNSTYQRREGHYLRATFGGSISFRINRSEY